LASPFSGWNSTALVQAVGRVQRHYFGKQAAVVLDYVDNSYPINILKEWSDGRTANLIKNYKNHIHYGLETKKD